MQNLSPRTEPCSQANDFPSPPLSLSFEPVYISLGHITSWSRSRLPRAYLSKMASALAAHTKIRLPCMLKHRVQQKYNSLLVNALNRIFKSNLSLNNFRWLLTKLELSCVRNVIPRSKSGASKSRPRWAAHTHIGNVWESPPPPLGEKRLPLVGYVKCIYLLDNLLLQTSWGKILFLCLLSKQKLNGFVPRDWCNTQVLKITEEWRSTAFDPQMARPSHDLNKHIEWLFHLL